MELTLWTRKVRRLSKAVSMQLIQRLRLSSIKLLAMDYYYSLRHGTKEIENLQSISS
jgi:hypothetical protein